MNGTASIRSQNINLKGVEIDALAGKLEAVQGMDLIKIRSILAGLLTPV